MVEVGTNEPLHEVTRQIEVHARKSDEHVISAALLLREARRRVEAGEAGAVTWYEWGPKNINLSLSRLRDLQRIAGADDPAKELERQRKLTQKRVEDHRARKTEAEREREEERRRLIGWAKKAPIDEVRRVLGLIENGRGAPLQGPVEGRPHQEQLEAA